MTIIGLVGGIASSLMGGAKKPPTPELPAPPAPMSKAPGATVRVGAADKNETSTPTEYKGFSEKRKTGTPYGGLGRGGLSI